MRESYFFMLRRLQNNITDIFYARNTFLSNIKLTLDLR